jgi:hypothetical protein
VYGKSAQQRRKEQGLPVTDRAGRAIGRLIGREYHKLVSRADQILRSPPGFGFDVWAMDFFVLPRVDELVVEDRVNGRVYRSSTENFKQHRIQINRGAGPQYVLPLAYWRVAEVVAPRRPAAPAPAPAPPATSPSSQGRLL